jgi:hypothetical protein
VEPLLGGAVVEGEVDVEPAGFVLDGMLLGGSVLGVVLLGLHGLETVAEVPLPTVALGPVVLAVAGVEVLAELVLLGLEVVLPVVAGPVPVLVVPVVLPVVHGATVVVVPAPVWLGVVVVL